MRHVLQFLLPCQCRSRSRVWQLDFQHKFPSSLFTCTKVVSVDGEPIRVVLMDPSSKKTITTGPLSSMKIEIVVLNGDFVADERETWTEEDFKRWIIRQREGKRPLVTGDLIITLKNGVADLDNICFTDNSCWIRCRKFRLGARLQGGSAEVREAKSEAFVVKDYRGEGTFLFTASMFYNFVQTLIFILFYVLMLLLYFDSYCCFFLVLYDQIGGQVYTMTVLYLQYNLLTSILKLRVILTKII